MKTLKLEQIVGYLPYGLKYKLPLNSERYESIMEEEPNRLALPFMTEEEVSKHFEKYTKMYLYQKNPQIMWDDNELFLGQMETSLGFEEDDVYLKEVLPYLFPLDYITKYREDLGFVPIVELYRLSNEYYDKKELEYEFVDSWGAGKILKVWNNREKEEYTEFIYGNFSFRKDTRFTSNAFGIDLPHPIRCNDKIFNQYLLFQKLQEWKFDIHGLIEKNLAIAVTEDFNPYK